MQRHPNALVLEKLYADFAKGDFQGVLDACAENITFQVSGKSRLAGKYTKANFVSDFAARLRELSGNTLKLEVHDILAGDLHAAVLMTSRLERSGKTIEYRTVHVWRFDGNKPLAWYEYPRDLYHFDQIWN